MDPAQELGAFLRSRRAQLTPQATGLPPTLGRRRVPGLRREEVAELAGVSLVYYVRLEQGRAANPSDAVLEALARVLRLGPTERTHLRDLARRPRTRLAHVAPSEPQPPRVRPGLRRLLDAVGATPAYVLAPSMDVLAANDLAHALVPGLADASFGPPNIARHIFLCTSARDLYPQWPEVARQTVGFLRFAAARHADDARLCHLVAELSRCSNEFRELWAAQEVREKTHGTKTFTHPVVGRFTLTYETLSLPAEDSQALVVFTAPDSTAETALRLLGSWAATGLSAV
ncbi:helix-turn-helix transcriptional regulator [Streptomyces sp. 549]|uniref:helix-turn-helix transcriptional regulator n=1 Tax=Streptomyces sp. 549 TaxID=3049076 RepID=UPI0024C2D173|nr:helix-turn-helix transcriptional regulator [Streptomyces sp. 549]MDK1472913.1 helix-turn-helix transcriptional regulator [Streptomyces sp. 549]